MSLTLLALAAAQAAQPRLAQPLRPSQTYAMCIRSNGIRPVDETDEAAWQASWREALAACRNTRQAWWAYNFALNPNGRDRANQVELMMMSSDEYLYERYRRPLPVIETIRDVFVMDRP